MRKTCASCITPSICLSDGDCGYGMVNLTPENNQTKGRAQALPDEVRVGPWLFEWDGENVFISDGEEVMANIEYVRESTWREFLKEAKPHYGPG